MTDSVKSAARGGYTSHGHPIPGAALYPPDRPRVARCGGVGLCAMCSQQSARWHSEQAQQRRLAVERADGAWDVINSDHWRERAEDAEAKLTLIRETLSSSPACDKYDDADTITCGWKRDMQAVRAILNGETEWLI